MAERLTYVHRVLKVWSSSSGRAKSYTTVRHRFNIYASNCVALALRRGYGHRNSLHASA